VLLLIDNYDSFTWNLVHGMGAIRPELRIEVCRNDQITVEEAEAMSPTHLVISPGPCTPEETGVCRDMLRHFAGRIPILGVCLGHQAIADVHGMDVVRHESPMHGKTSPIHHDGQGIFQGLPNPFQATRYHSLIVSRDSVVEDFEVCAWTEQDDIMALRWKGGWPHGSSAPMIGVQFHPESFLTTRGPTLLENFIATVGDPSPATD
tara:strand:- start:39 stop:656 length:618 start_codon:yes stop_codon:yes gene_type:complete